MSQSNYTSSFSKNQIGFIYSVVSEKVSYSLRADKHHHVYRYLSMLIKYEPHMEPQDVVADFIFVCGLKEDYLDENGREWKVPTNKEFNNMRENLTKETIKLAFYRFLRRQVQYSKHRKELEIENSQIIINNFSKENTPMDATISYTELITYLATLTGDNQLLIQWRLTILTMDEVKTAMNCSRETVQRKWKALKAQLVTEFRG